MWLKHDTRLSYISDCAITCKNNNIYYANGKQKRLLRNTLLILFSFFTMIATQSNNCFTRKIKGFSYICCVLSFYNMCNKHVFKSNVKQKKLADQKILENDGLTLNFEADIIKYRYAIEPDITSTRLY